MWHDSRIELAHLRVALDSVPAFVYIKDLQSRYLYGNRCTLELFGCTAEELCGRGDADFFPQDTVEHLRRIDLLVFDGYPQANEIEVIHPQRGRQIYWEVKTALYSDLERRTVGGLLGISTDITESRCAAESHRHQIDELMRWQKVMLDRERRVIELKQEVNELCGRLGVEPRYLSQIPGAMPVTRDEQTPSIA
jgi:PAS domain S-box-containing protein